MEDCIAESKAERERDGEVLRRSRADEYPHCTMTKTLVECVPNFSEGRDKAKVDAIVEAMRLPGVYLLDCEMDPDHNRSVITLVGEREAIEEAAILGVGKAAELIDLTQHTGAHPRMGAADVVPFIPLSGVTLEDCVAMARRVGEQIAKRHGIPVYLYEAAATRPERQGLEQVRKGQFEGIREEIGTNPARKPDFGEAKVHPTAGATAVGARKFLIAYNVFLNTADVDVAKKVAKAVRFSSGGLRFVKGAGFLVRGMAQVSMNLTDFEQTPMHRVFEMVKNEAARYGAAPVSSEIVGLVPKAALEQVAEWFLQVENFDSSLILENRLAAVMGGTMAVGGLRAGPSAGVAPFIEQLAAPTATPGGGSAAAASGAMAAGLAAMVATMSRGKKAYAEHTEALSTAIARLTALREELKAAIDADAESYNVVMQAYRAAKETNNGGAGVNAALQQAAAAPLGVAEKAHEVGRIAEHLRPITNPNMASDLTTARALARAAVEGALANVEINVGTIEPKTAEDEAFVTTARKRAAELRER
ncbi:MAG TPA: glutamate formimidoyltransferase [Terracidiphilus sp.]|nr:glutamate formimidoyltransferase [Terracidiphilus sp.]